MADNAPERDARWPIDTILLADWPTMLRKNGALAAFSSDFCSYYTYFYRRTSIILAYFWLDLLADHGPEYVRDIALRALNILKSYSGKSYREAEGEFNRKMSVAEKRTVIVALHKLGIPFGVPSNDTFKIREIHFVDTVVNDGDIDGIILQITQGYCDNLFYIDPDTYFASGFTLFAMRNAGKKYVTEILAKSKVNTETKMMTEPIELGSIFTLGEFKAIQVLREQVRDQMYFDKNGEPIKERIDTLLKDIDLGLWDSYLMWNYENYQSVKAQVQMGQIICNPQPLINPMPVSIPEKMDEKEVE